MKKLILIAICSAFLVACNANDKEDNENVLEVKENVEQTISKEVENENFKLIVNSEKLNYSLGEPIVFTAELHYIGLEQEIEVYSNSTLIDYQIISDDGTFELSSRGEDSANSFVIKKNQPHVEIFEFDKKRDGTSLLNTMVAGNYTIKIQVSYGVENNRDEENLVTEINFKISE